MSYPLFHSHLDFAHAYWKQLLQPDCTVIDATCGNGHDTLMLAQLGLTSQSGKLYSFDIQQQAIKNTQELLRTQLAAEICARVVFYHQSHAQFPDEIKKQSVNLIVYNLGYLPKGDKAITTMTDTTLQSLTNAQDLLCDGGVLSITCYPGHDEGMREEAALLKYFEKLNRFEWNCSHHRWINRLRGPSLIMVQKLIKPKPKNGLQAHVDSII